LTAREDALEKGSFVCPICAKWKNREMFHCHDHCMDMCRDHIRKTRQGLYVCVKCDKPVHRFVHNGKDWVEK
jgi:hypothetical protein